MEIKKANHIKGQIHIPGDKSISHRGVMFGAIADGTTEQTVVPRSPAFKKWALPLNRMPITS